MCEVKSEKEPIANVLPESDFLISHMIGYSATILGTNEVFGI